MNICDEIESGPLRGAWRIELEIFISPKKTFKKIFMFWEIFFWIFNSNLNIMNIYLHELNIYESIMRALNIQINIQKYAWIFKIWIFIWIFNFFEYSFCEINIQKRLEYSWYLWIFKIFKWVWSPDVKVNFGWCYLR